MDDVVAARKDQFVPHEYEVDLALVAELERLSTHGSIGSTGSALAAPSGSYTQAEVAALTTRVNLLATMVSAHTDILVDAHLIPPD